MAKINFKFGDFCRLCLKQAEDLVYLKAVDTDLVSFVDKLEFVNNALKPENDVFPNWICLRCKKQLIFAYKFSKKCLKSLTVLNECLIQIQQNHFGDMSKQFYITNIKNIQKNMTSDEDPLTLKDDDIPSLQDDNSINFDEISIPIKQEPDDIIIDEHPIDKFESSDILIENSVDNITTIGESSNQDKVKVEPQFEQNVEVRNHFLSQTSDDETSPNDLLVPTDSFRDDTNRKKNTRKPNVPKSDSFKSDKLIFTCSICFRSYQSETLLANHISMHENIYACALCGKSFKVRELLARHLESHLTDEEDVYVCKICGEKFKNVRKFREHYSNHNKKDKKSQKVAPTKEMFENAYKQKIKKEIFECNICNDKFTQKRLLIVHMRSHFD